MSKLKTALLFAICCLLFAVPTLASWTTDLTPPTVTISIPNPPLACNTSVNPIRCPANTDVNVTVRCEDLNGSGCLNLPPPSVLGNVTGNIDLAQGTITISGPVRGSDQTITIPSVTGTDYAGNNSNSSSLAITFLPPLAVSCTGTASGMSINWSAAPATGGTSPYIYSWSGTDNLLGTGQTISKTYTTAGAKSATITATDSTSPAITATNSCTATVSCPAAQSCTSTCHTDTQYVHDGTCGQTSCPPNQPAAQSCTSTCHTDTQYVPNGSCGQTTCSPNAPAAQSCPTTCHTDDQTVPNGSCGQTSCPHNQPAAQSCPTTCHTDTQYVHDGTSCSQTKSCGPNAPAAGTPPACRTSGGSVPDGQCSTTLYQANCTTSCSNDACVPAAFTLNTTPTTSCQGVLPTTSISWGSSAEAQNYEIFRNNTSIGNTTQTIYNDNNLSNNTSYSYYVEAINGPNKTRSNTVTITSSECRPDLIVQNPAVAGTLLAGQTLTLSGTVKNQGVSNAGASTTQFKIDGVQVPDGAITTGTIAANSTEAKQTTWTAIAGDHTLDVCADSTNVVGESSETNNCSSTTTPVTSVTFHVNQPPTCTLINGPATLNTSQSGSYNATAGDPDTSDTITYSWSSTPAGGTFTSTTSQTTNWSAATPGSYDINLTVTDNSGATATCPTKTVAVDWPAVSTSCSVTSPTPPATATVGEPVTWTATASGGNGTYSYTWSGDIPLAGKTGNPVNVTYSTTGTKNGSVAVASAGKNGNATCSTTIEILPPPPPQPVFAANSPSAICSGNQSSMNISWTVSDATWIGSYQIFRSDNPTIPLVPDPTCNSTSCVYLDNTVSPGSSYWYKVRTHSTDPRVGPVDSEQSSSVIAKNCANPTVNLLVNGDGSTHILHNTEATLTWTSNNATLCEPRSNPATSWTNTPTKPLNNLVPGESTGRLTNASSPYIFSLDCTNENIPLVQGSNPATSAVQVDVDAPLPPFIQTTGGDVHTQERINTPGSQ